MSRSALESSDERSVRSRYPGTHPFSDSADDFARFFGRNEEGEQLYLRVLSVPLLVQFGKSGLGKTSLLQARLFPYLRQKPFLPVMVRLNAADDTLTFAVARSIRQSCNAEGLELAEGQKDGLWELLSTTTVWRDDLLLTPVLVFDQFEEVFTLRDTNFRADLAVELGALASGIRPERSHAGRSGVPDQFVARPNVKIVISLREDYLGALQEFSAAIPSLFHERLRLEPLIDNDAREAITRPAQLKPGTDEEPYWAPCFHFEAQVLDRIIDFLKGNSGVIEPFQLQLLCRHAEAIAYDKAGAQNDSVELTLADLNGATGLVSVLKNFYGNTLRKLPRSQRKRAEVLCVEGLLDASGHRLMLEEGQIQRKFGLEAESLTALSRERLLSRERRHESVFYEISHDRLAESIFAFRRFRLPTNVKRGLWAAGFATLLLVGGLIWWNQNLVSWNQKVQQARDRAEVERKNAQQARDRADAERQNAEGLLSFLLGDFLGEVREAGRSTMLEQVRAKVEPYVVASDRGASLNGGLALRNSGDLERTHGFLANSVKLFVLALKIFESGSNGPTAPREAARTHDRLGEALADQGQVTQALTHYEAEVKAWRQVATSSSDPAAATDDLTSLADSLVTAGEMKNRMGQATVALTDLEEALKIVSNLLFGRQITHEGSVAGKVQPYPEAKVLDVFSHAVLTRAEILSEEEDYEGAAVLGIQARALNPPSISIRRDSLDALDWRGNERVSKTPKAALNDYRKGLEEFEELRRWDPNNRVWQRERAAAQLEVSDGIVACQVGETKNPKTASSLEEAEAMSFEAIATLSALAEVDPSNVSLQNDLGWAFQAHARVLAAQGRQDERLAFLVKSEQAYRNSQSDSADADSVKDLAELLQDKSDALTALNRMPEANETLQKSFDLLQGLISAHPDNPNYVSEVSVYRQREAKFRRKAGDTTGADTADRESKQMLARNQVLIANRQKERENLWAIHADLVTEGVKLSMGGDYTAALRKFNAAESAMREYIRLRPSNFIGYNELRRVYYGIQDTQEKLGNDEERTARLSASMHAAQIAAWLAPEGSRKEMNTKLLDARRALGIFLYDNKHLDEALAMVQEEVVVAGVLAQGATQTADYLERLGNAEAGLGRVRRAGKHAGWEEALRSGLIYIQKAAEMDLKEPDYPRKVGRLRKYLAEQLAAEGQKKESSAEYARALKAYQQATKRAPDDKDAREAIRDLGEHGIR